MSQEPDCSYNTFFTNSDFRAMFWRMILIGQDCLFCERITDISLFEEVIAGFLNTRKSEGIACTDDFFA